MGNYMTQVQLSSAGPAQSIEHLAAEREDLSSIPATYIHVGSLNNWEMKVLPLLCKPKNQLDMGISLPPQEII